MPGGGPKPERRRGAPEAEPEARRRPPVEPKTPLSPQALLALYRPDVSGKLGELSAPSYRHLQVFEHLLRHPLRPFGEASALPGDLRDTLDHLGVSVLTELQSRTSPDGTTKLLLSGRDRKNLETVLMRYRERLTVCTSSQIGCAVGCLFCATGGMGFQRNLTVAEIVDQVRACSALGESDGRRVSNLVYMGMGEPLLNLQAVLDSIRVLTDARGLGLSHRAISVSTVGVPSGILRLARTEPQVNLALSLHAANDQTRALLVPSRFRHPIAQILAAAWEHFSLTRRKLLIEYVLIKGINDSPSDARSLVSLLKGHVVAVNLLRWNPIAHTEACRTFQASTPAAVSAFRDVLTSSHIEAVVRQSKGAAIQGACGQLAGTAGRSA